MRIAIDAMGGDRAPQVIVEGTLLAASESSAELVLVGDPARIRSEIARFGAAPKNVTIHPAGSVIEFDEPAAQSVRRKKDASICVAADLVKACRAEAVVTAGHTGAAIAACTLKLRLLDGVERPGIGIAFPTLEEPSFLIDVGANIETKPVHLFQYAVMGEVYMRYILGRKRPTIGILNVGEEDSKGTEQLHEAREMLERSSLDFIGNVEGRDIFTGKVDVIVCDGFVGNVVLKVAESITEVIGILLRKEIKKNYLAILGAVLSKSAFNSLKRKVDYAEYGGAPLLGTNGTCIISHGASNPKAIKNAIRVAGEFIRREINRHIVEELGRQTVGAA